MIKAIVFDMDGVLFDTERLNRIVLNEAAREQGADISEEVFLSMLGANLEASRQIIQKAYPQVDYGRLSERWNELAFERIAKYGMPLKKGMPEILHTLKARGLKIGLATSSDREAVSFYLEKCGLQDMFDASVCGSEAPNSKPAPDIYLKCAALLNVPPADCAGVEDSLNGVKAVRAAGMYCVMIPDILPYGDPHAPYVDKVLEDLTALAKIC